jgi:hypothetical protein
MDARKERVMAAISKSEADIKLAKRGILKSARKEFVGVVFKLPDGDIYKVTDVSDKSTLPYKNIVLRVKGFKLWKDRGILINRSGREFSLGDLLDERADVLVDLNDVQKSIKEKLEGIFKACGKEKLTFHYHNNKFYEAYLFGNDLDAWKPKAEPQKIEELDLGKACDIAFKILQD